MRTHTFATQIYTPSPIYTKNQTLIQPSQCRQKQKHLYYPPINNHKTAVKQYQIRNITIKTVVF
nr:MAG TPA: hypothetical protein [Caudoviricetes sp.]